MKKSPDRRLLLISSIFFVLGFFWLCFAFPQKVTTGFEALGIILFVLVITAPVVGPLLAGLAGAFSSRPPAPPATPPEPPRSHIRERDTLTPLLLGVTLGWWLRGGSGDNGDHN